MTNPSTDSIWSHLSADLRRFIRSRVPDEHVADDLLQEAFLRIHRSIDSLADAERVGPWVYQITRNVIHDYYRATQTSAISLGDHPYSESEDHANELRSRQSAEWMNELIRELPEKYQEAVQLSEIEGLTQKVVADRLGLSLSGAKSRIQRGRAMLKIVLDQCCAFEFDRRGNLMDIIPRPNRTVCQNCDERDDSGASCS